MKFLSSFILLSIIAGLAYLIGINIIDFTKPIKFFISSTFSLLMSYFLIWYNIWTMKKSGELSGKKILAPSIFGHVVNVVGSLGIGYGFIESNKIIIIPSIFLLIMADSLLTKTKDNSFWAKCSSINSKIDPN